MQKILNFKIQELPESTAKNLAEKISEEIQKFVPDGHMIAKTPGNILNSYGFVVFTNSQTNKIFGFYEIRKHNFQNGFYWEMGSVISKQANFFQDFLLPNFLERQNNAGIKQSFLVTKSKKLAEKFAKIANGKIGPFPQDFPRVKDDRFCVFLSK